MGQSAQCCCRNEDKGMTDEATVRKHPYDDRTQSQGETNCKPDSGKSAHSRALTRMTPEELAQEEGSLLAAQMVRVSERTGINFFVSSLAQGRCDMKLLIAAVRAMNSAKYRGKPQTGSSHLAKLIFSAGAREVIAACYVPEDLADRLTSVAWLQLVMAWFGGEVTSTEDHLCIGRVQGDGQELLAPMINTAYILLCVLGVLKDENERELDRHDVTGLDSCRHVAVKMRRADVLKDLESQTANWDTNRLHTQRMSSVSRFSVVSLDPSEFGA